MAAVFAIIAASPLRRGHSVRLWAAAVAALFAVVAFAFPALLHTANLAWTRLSVLLGRIVTPVVMAALFFAVITPAAVALRLFRRDPLKLAFQPDGETYWIARQPPGPAGQSMTNQF